MALKKAKKPCGDWSWVGSEVRTAEGITERHRARAAGVEGARLCPFPGNDDKGCTERRCKDSVGCLNHLGAEEALKLKKKDYIEEHLGEQTKLRNGAAGLRNLGATCYVNAFIQLWYHNPALRDAVYRAVTTENKTTLFHLGSMFASLDLSERQVIDPSPLLKKLGLNKQDQQDAAEFGKLFLDLIAEDFKRSPDPEIKTLTKDLFEGRSVSRIRCLNCGTESTTEQAFQELDINLKNGSTIEECLRAQSVEELLDGDNKYACQACGTPQIAAKSLRPTHFPPILHLNLMRFTFNGTNRVKSKAVIKYGKRLVLDGLDYELRGVLTHLGASAHHGHYICDVYDQDRDLWLHCNDEEVNIPDRKKKRRIDSPEVDMNSSKDAYMLVYYRQSYPSPRPPSHVLQNLVEKDNLSLRDEINDRGLRRKVWDDEFDHMDGAKRDVIRVLPGRDKLVPRSELARFLQADKLEDMYFQWDWSTITCEHEGIDPAKTTDAKLISEHAYDKLLAYADKLSAYTPLPDLSICSICVENDFARRTHLSNHADCIAEYDRLLEGPYVVSKRWIDDWHRHQAQGTPTDALYCEHGARWENCKVYKISEEAIVLLRSVVGDFEVYQNDEPVCGTCAEDLARGKEAEEEDRQMAKEERKWTKLISPNPPVFKQDYYLLPTKFVDAWMEWMRLGGTRATLDMELCEHGGLDWDPMMKGCAYTSEEVWEEICKRYGTQTPVVIQFGSNPLPGKRRNVVSVTPPVCEECRVAKARDFEEATIYVIREDSNDKIINGNRTSRSRAKEFEVKVKKTTTVKDIKLEICAEFALSPISQRLYYADIELDSAQTVESLGIMADDRLRLEVAHEVIDIDDDTTQTKEGFGGTALLGRKQCPWCTFENPAKAEQCEICERVMMEIPST